MTGKKKTDQKLFKKKELMESKRFEGYRDLLKALLEEAGEYSIQETEDILNRFLKGEVKTWH